MPEKGLNMQILEVKQSLVQVVNNSKVPALVLQMILQEVLDTVKTQTKMVLEQEQALYDKSIEEDASNNK